MKSKKQQFIKVRALRSMQAIDREVFNFFLPGAQITQIADISRLQRDENNELHGFQRKAIRSHVSSIVDYLDSGPVLFPNAIILALSSSVSFKPISSRSTKDLMPGVDNGTLMIPVADSDNNKSGWIVDGQQRALALAESRHSDLPVPVVAFIADDLKTQREQFILVNKAKPLPPRLIDELLPEVDTRLPADLAARRIPSELCNSLNQDVDSPFRGLIARESTAKSTDAVVPVAALMDLIQKSLENPVGALAPYKGVDYASSDVQGMLEILKLFWNSVSRVFSQAWGQDANHSLLMHPAGLKAMGSLMDRLMARAAHHASPEQEVLLSLQNISGGCHWTEGHWEQLGLDWNQLRNNASHVKALARQLVKLDFESNRRQS